jgi:hypothetical protein
VLLATPVRGFLKTGKNRKYLAKDMIPELFGRLDLGTKNRYKSAPRMPF